MMKRKALEALALKKGGDVAEIFVSTESVDRDRDRVLAGGADLKSYKRNPVVMYGHDLRSIPVGRATSVTAVADQGIRAAWKWLNGDEFAERVKNAWDQGVLNATSIGFLPRRWKENKEGGLDFTEWELLEFSVVPVPANPEAVRVLRSLGLGGGEVIEVDPAQVDAAVRRALQPIPEILRRRLGGTTPRPSLSWPSNLTREHRESLRKRRDARRGDAVLIISE
jgi:HK97 family phage prohead protease